MDENRVPETMFGSLHADTFRLLTGKLRWFYAELLEYLNDSLFTDGGIVYRAQVIDTIRSYIDRQALNIGHDSEADGETDFLNANDTTAQAQIAYSRLIETGWFIEHRDRYRKLVDLDASARLLLDFLLDIKSGKLRSYGGEVLQVLTSLEAARGDPENRSEAVRNAAKSSRSFLNHLRSVGSAMRKAEEIVLGQRDLNSLFRRFFDDFVARHLIEDYKRLHTQANPFRFRVRILELSAEMEANDLLLRQLGDAYVREGRSHDADQAVDIIISELRQVQRVFQDLDAFLDVIEETSQRVERRIRNTVRYMDRIAETRTERVAEAFRALSEAPIASGDIVDVPARSLQGTIPLGGTHLFQAALRRQPIGPRVIRRPVQDPAYVAYEKALQEYRLRRVVTPRKVAEYLERVLGDQTEIRAIDLPVETLDDFFVFERLRTVEYLEGGVLASRYRVCLETGLCDNGWLICENFTISRQTGSVDAA